MVNTLTVKGCDLQVFLYFCARVIAVKMSIGGGQAFLSPMISALLEGQNRREFPHHSVHFFFLLAFLTSSAFTHQDCSIKPSSFSF